MGHHQIGFYGIYSDQQFHCHVHPHSRLMLLLIPWVAEIVLRLP
ncbi:unnamed protein product [Musa acuminata subsp. malaccensis]|uniref:(wild Malaysian banana) hypothetical protein n=1 Tax=Musa acuminata subsp. malaccensis TaxID=214687 RepID=A0A804HQK3_MUSAM|nr:unnamed protein product [Musa acuminata subsp. malaccensis]